MGRNGFTVGATILGVVGVLFVGWALTLPDAAAGLGVAGGMLLVIAFIVWRLGSQLGSFTYNGRKVLRDGDPARAHVTAVEESSVVVNQNPVLKVTMEVEPEDGEAYEVTVRQLIERHHAPSIVPGADVEVRIDQTNPRKVVIAFV